MHGFSLVEALVAMALISFMVLSIFTVFPQARKGLALSENRLNAAYIGRSILDDQRSRDYDALAASTGSLALSGTNNNAPFSQQYNYAVNVNAVGTHKKHVWVVVSWKDKGGDRQVTMETIVVKL